MSSNSFDGDKRILDTTEHSTLFWRNTGYSTMLKVFTIHLFGRNAPEASQLD